MRSIVSRMPLEFTASSNFPNDEVNLGNVIKVGTLLVIEITFELKFDEEKLVAGETTLLLAFWKVQRDGWNNFIRRQTTTMEVAINFLVNVATNYKIHFTFKTSR